MTETHNVFISWSGPRSKRAAEVLKDWLPLVVPTANPWMSETNIDKGTRWREEVATALNTMKAGVICLTPENLTAEWLLFEAGALSKTRDPKTRVWTYLLAGLTIPDLTDPLAMFNATKAEEEDTRKLVHSINTNLDTTVPDTRVDRLFDKFWPDLKKDLDAIPAPSDAAPTKRSPDEIAAESLELLRSIAPLIQDIASESDIARRIRLAEGEWYNAIRKVEAGTSVVTPSGYRYFVDILKPVMTGKLSELAGVGAMEAPAEPTASSNQPLPSSPRRKTHAPGPRGPRKHVSPSPKAKT